MHKKKYSVMKFPNYFLIIIVNYFKDIFRARMTNFFKFFPIKYFI